MLKIQSMEETATLLSSGIVSHISQIFSLHSTTQIMLVGWFAIMITYWDSEMVRYHDNLLRLRDIHPGVYEEFKDGCFSIRRIRKPFSGSPIDLTLEQTMNANAASKKMGISYLTNSISGHFLRTSIITDALDELSISKQEDVTQDLTSNRVRRNNAGR